MAHFAIWNHPLSSQAQTQAPVVASPRLQKAAQEFEANFLQELLKPLKQDPLFAGGDGLGGGDSADGEMSGSLGTVDSLGTQALADALAKAGGLGIAKHILAQMAPVEAANEAKANEASGKGSQSGASPKNGTVSGANRLKQGNPITLRPQMQPLR